MIVFMFFGMFSGSVMTETVFAYNGIGRVLFQAIGMRDTMLINALNLIFASLGVLAMLAADIVYSFVDPRIKLR
jgi:peptide/nickel transport system permease protein